MLVARQVEEVRIARELAGLEILSFTLTTHRGIAARQAFFLNKEQMDPLYFSSRMDRDRYSPHIR
jgi:hypothetical protein